MNVLVLMAGSDESFKAAGHMYPKNLIEIDQKPLVQHVVDSLRPVLAATPQAYFCLRRTECKQFYTDSVLKLLVNNASIIEVPDSTAGAACTALLAVEAINNDEPLFIVNGDQVITSDLTPALASFRERRLDGGIVVFESTHPRWSYVKCNADGYVIEAAEKRPISKTATAGAYYFRTGRQFVESAFSMIEKFADYGGSYYICPVYNELILRQAKIGVHEIPRDSYLSLANPVGLTAYQDYLHQQRAHS